MKQRNLLYSFKHLLKAVKACKNKELAMKVLYKLRYFIKSSDFAEEKELRMLDLCEPAKLKVVEGTYKLYSEYINIFKYPISASGTLCGCAGSFTSASLVSCN